MNYFICNYHKETLFQHFIQSTKTKNNIRDAENLIHY